LQRRHSVGGNAWFYFVYADDEWLIGSEALEMGGSPARL